MTTFVDTEERETERLRQAEEEGLAQQTLTPVIKECLRLKILSDRHSHGLPEYKTLFSEPVKHELRDDEKEKLERRKQQNREAARRCRQKKKLQKTATETAYHEELRFKSDMDAEIRGIQRELDSMQKFLIDHLKSGSCRIAHLPDSLVGYFPDQFPVSAPCDFCHTPGGADSPRQAGNQYPPEIRHPEGREVSQGQIVEHGVITSNLTAQLSEHHRQTSERNQSPTWTVSDKEHLHNTGPTVELLGEGRTSNGSISEVPRGHVSPGSYQVQQFHGSQSPGCGSMQTSPVPPADSQCFQGVCGASSPTLQTLNDLDRSIQTLNMPLEVGVDSFQYSDTMADNTDSILARGGSLCSEQRHTHHPRNATLPQTSPRESTVYAEVAVGHHSDHPEDFPRVDVQVFPEDLHNWIFEEIHGTPEELHGLYTIAGDKTQPNFLMV